MKLNICGVEVVAKNTFEVIDKMEQELGSDLFSYLNSKTGDVPQFKVTELFFILKTACGGSVKDDELKEWIANSRLKALEFSIKYLSFCAGIDTEDEKKTDQK